MLFIKSWAKAGRADDKEGGGWYNRMGERMEEMDLLLAFFAFLILAALCMAMGKSLSWALLGGLVCFVLVGLRRGHTARELGRMAGEEMKTAAKVLRIPAAHRPAHRSVAGLRNGGVFRPGRGLPHHPRHLPAGGLPAARPVQHGLRQLFGWWGRRGSSS